MKYARVHNYSHRASLSKYKSQGYYKRKSNRNPRNFYSHRFYLAIFLILISCGLYIRYQSLYVEDSLFYHLYQGMIKPKWLHYQSKKQIHSTAAIKKNEKKKTTASSYRKQLKQNHSLQKKNSPTLKKSQTKKTISPPTSSSTKLTTSIQNVLYYTVQTKKDSNLLKLSPQRGSMVSFHEKDYYYNLVSRLIEYKQNSQSLDVFSTKTVLLKSWVEKDTLLLDFNGAFQFSKLGDKGIILQIQQILWTIFRNNPNHIRYVSFLIEGKRKINLGGHGLQLKPFYSEKDLVRIINLPRKIH